MLALLSIICGMVGGLVLGTTAYWTITVFFGITMGIFLLQSLKYITMSMDGTGNQQRYFLAFMGFLQILLSVFLSRQSLSTTAAS